MSLVSVACGSKARRAHGAAFPMAIFAISLRRLRWGLAAVGALAVISVSASADDPRPKRLSDSHLLSGSVVRWSFREATDVPRTWTVQLLREDQELALGAIVGAEGWILTKGSELKSPVTCRLSDGRRFPAAYIGYHPETDLALLKIEAENLPEVSWSESTAPSTGQWLITPGTGRRPVAVGVVSVERRVLPRKPFRGFLGIEFDLESTTPMIRRVVPESGAEAAGIQAGDLILSINERPMKTRQEVFEEIGAHRPGTSIVVRVQRGALQITASATLSHELGEFHNRIAQQNHMGGALSFRRDDFPTVIQYDAVLEPAQCGGPVVNLSSQAVGLNIARAGRTETYVLPHDVFRPLLDDLKSGRYAPPPDQLGARLSEEPFPPAPPQAVPWP